MIAMKVVLQQDLKVGHFIFIKMLFPHTVGCKTNFG